MSSCCPDCQAMHRTPLESARYHVRLAQQLAAEARVHARRAQRWNGVVLVLVGICAVLLVISAVVS